MDCFKITSSDYFRYKRVKVNDFVLYQFYDVLEGNRGRSRESVDERICRGLKEEFIDMMIKLGIYECFPRDEDIVMFTIVIGPFKYEVEYRGKTIFIFHDWYERNDLRADHAIITSIYTYRPNRVVCYDCIKIKRDYVREKVNGIKVIEGYIDITKKGIKLNNAKEKTN